MNRFWKIALLLFVGGIVVLPFGTMLAQRNNRSKTVDDEPDYDVPADTLPSYTVKPAQQQTYDDLTQQYPMDLQPSNVQTSVEYDPNTATTFSIPKWAKWTSPRPL